MNLDHLIPLLDVKDVDESIAFYADALGFTVEDKLIWDGRTDWALLKSGMVEIMLSAIREHPERRWSLSKAGIFFFYLDDPEHLYTTLQEKGYTISDIQHGHRGAKEFCLQDPDGYVLWFSPKKGERSSADRTTA